MTSAHADRRWMEQALALAALGDGSTSPNPRVGCVLVRDGRVVGSGFHAAYGGAHAESLAVRRAGEAARGATAYVNLEPCAHEGHTPPCADLLVSAGVSRVVAALVDPNPIVDGRGFERLRRSGVQVEVGLLSEEAARLNAAFLVRHREGRPLVTLKAATTLDGLLSARGGNSRWITSEPARRFAHRLRAAHDAVLVGAETVRRDDPRLTVRLAGEHRNPIRVVLAPRLHLDPNAAFFREGPPAAAPRIYAGSETGVEAERALRGLATIVRVPCVEGRLDLTAVLTDLLERRIQSVLVEGGARTLGAFLEAGLADRVALFQASRLLGAGGATPLIDLPSVPSPDSGWRVQDVRQLALGPDRLWLGSLASRGG